VQINGKLRSHLRISPDASEADMEKAALADPKIQESLVGKQVRKVIVVRGRLVNIVAA
jgi:leucyl-tRNA synthetase